MKMEMEFMTKGKQRVTVHYVNALYSGVVEENFGGYFHDRDDISLAEVLQDQEVVYQSLQRNVQCSGSRSSSNHDHGQSSSKLVSLNSQLAADEAFARELEELENQLSATFFGDIRTKAGNVEVWYEGAARRVVDSSIRMENSFRVCSDGATGCIFKCY